MRVLGVAVTSAGALPLAPAALDGFAAALVRVVDAMLRRFLRPCLDEPSVLTVQVDLRPPREATCVAPRPHRRAGAAWLTHHGGGGGGGGSSRFRLSKSWVDTMPQAPTITMKEWSETLHSVAAPEMAHGRVEFQVIFRIA